ncbi:hypothetical protein Lal_00015818 [Lupinus albus]|nr:hypothetical protein Lal_00015818 [Lupinus albus]
MEEEAKPNLEEEEDGKRKPKGTPKGGKRKFRGLIEKMASDSQQFNARSSDAIIVRGVHDVGTDSVRQEKLERKIDSLTTLVTQLAMNQPKQPMARVCGICTSPDHYSDVCLSLLEPRTTDHPEAYAANIYNNRPNQQQQNYDPSSSRYNPGWRNHPNLKCILSCVIVALLITCTLELDMFLVDT